MGGGRKRKYRDGGRMTSDVVREESNKKDKPVGTYGHLQKHSLIQGIRENSYLEHTTSS